MQYNVLSKKKHPFIITPDELRVLLKDFHHIIVNTGVEKSYTESNPNDFLLAYDALYQKLKNGEKLVWKNNHNIIMPTIGITRHLENCLYKPTDKLCVPNFLEPCPWIETFCFTVWKGQLSTSFSVTQFPENVCGLCLYFPTKIEYESSNAKYPKGIVLHTDLDDFESYETLLSGIKMITRPLKLEFHGKLHRTTVRISNEAKKDLEHFYFITSNHIKIL